ncbi:MAG TPA: histidinol-phosphate transaminase [Candidatus Methylomirabilis sp.]|nr:histidinol-phosphate transaminase [Candidatus Methylomirabilis sp.]
MTGAAADILRLATPGVRELSPYQPGKPIEELEREYGVTDIIKLASNENPLGPSPRALEAARRTLADVHRYPDGNGFVLKQALARRLGLSTAQITLGNGSNDILELLARAFVLPENEVVFSEHAFAVYPIVTRAVGATAVVIKARNWGHDLAAMRAAVNPRTRLVFIANPNNPTGTWLAAGELEAFLQAVSAHVLVAVDEAYFEYVREPGYPDTTKWLARFPNLITTRTFSKAYGLAGLRVGYGVSSAAIADILNRVRQPFNVSSVALAAATAALADEAHVARAVENNRAGMRQLTEAFAALKLGYIPSAGNFVCVDCGRAAAPLYERLLREGVIVRPVANYGMPTHLRVTVGLPEENKRFIKALEKAMRTQS